MSVHDGSEYAPFMGDHNQQKNTAPGIDFKLQDYFTLLDWTGRTIRKNQRGAITANIVPLLD